MNRDGPMAYAFEPNDRDISSGLRRIAGAELAAATAALNATEEPADLIHGVRKRIKMLRGLLRLVRPAFDDYERENGALRDAAHVLAPLRSADVFLTTAGRLKARAEPALQDALAALCAWSLDHPHRVQIEPRADRIRAARDILAEVAARAHVWQVRGKGFGALQDGLRHTLRRTRRRQRQAERGGDDEVLHEWRQRVKDHWYHARLLAPIWPEMMNPHIAATDDLAEMLGDYQDLSDFRAHLSAAPLAAGLIHQIDRLAARRQAKLRARALTLGQRLFGGTDEALLDRWEIWWTSWRKARD